MTDEAVAASRATLTCEENSHSQVTRCFGGISPISPGVSDKGGRESGADHQIIRHSPDLASIIVKRNRYCLTDWANSWKRTHCVTQYRNSKASSSEGSRGLTPVSLTTMEKTLQPKSSSNLNPVTVSTSWVWKDDPVEIKEKKTWQRSYSDFMRSPYTPKTIKPSPRQSKQRMSTYRVARCRAWLNSHSGWLQ